MNKLVL